MKEFIDAFKHYADFSGRATRREFWMFILFYSIINLIISLIDPTVLYGIFWIVTIIPSFSITVRRLRDAGFNVWWVLLSLIPVLGVIILVFMCIKPSVGVVDSSQSSESTNTTSF